MCFEGLKRDTKPFINFSVFPVPMNPKHYHLHCSTPFRENFLINRQKVLLLFLPLLRYFSHRQILLFLTSIII